MKLTNRERVLLGILLTVLVLYVEYTYLLRGQISSTMALASTKAELSQRLEAAQNAAASEQVLTADLEKSQTAAYSVLDKYFVTSQQEDLILLVHDLLENTGVDVSGITFASPEEAQVGNASFRKVTMTLAFSAGYGDLEKLLKKIWDYKKMIAVDNITMSRSETTVLNGTLDLGFYYLNGHEGLNYQDNLYQIMPDDSFYKADPFAVSAGASDFRVNYLYTGGKEPGDQAYVPYADIKGHWAERYINSFGESGFLPPAQGVDFGPDTPMTRGEFIVMLDRIYQWPMPDKPVDLKQFSDYSTLGSYENAIAKAVTKGFLGGYVVGFSDNTLRPRDSMTYEEMEFVIQKLKNQPDFTWNTVAEKLQSELGVISPGLSDKKGYMTKAEAVYLMATVK